MIRAEELERARRVALFVEAVRAVLNLDRYTDPVTHWAEPDAKLRLIAEALLVCDGPQAKR